MSSAATNPLTSPSPASRARHALVRRRSPAAAAEPRQRRRLDREEDEDEDDDDEPHSDTAVGTAAGSSQSQPLPALPKDTTNDDDDGSSYAASGSSDSEDSVPAASSSRELRLRGVRDEPTAAASPPRSPSISEVPVAAASRGIKRERSPSVVSLPELVSKRPKESNIHASQTEIHLTQRRPVRADGGAGKTGQQHARQTGSMDLAKRLKEHKRISARSSHHQVSVEVPLPQASSTPKRAQPVSKLSRRTILPEPVTTNARSPPDDGSAAAVKQFLSGIGLGQSHFQILYQEGIRTQQDLDGLRQMEKECVVELRDVLRARGFTAFEFSKIQYAITRRKY